MNAYAKNFQCALDRARDRLMYARKQRAAYEAYANDSEPSKRTLRTIERSGSFRRCNSRVQGEHRGTRSLISECLVAG
jgi:hypothetical protein